ncbi:MAG: chromosomal replication initiator protein DnaA [Erysipelothrix sp.]|nr:chromosomal replication initiator protein DnaA [Erysipelothrix sp.]
MSEENSYLKNIWKKISEDLSKNTEAIDPVVYTTYFTSAEIYEITKNNIIRLKVGSNMDKMILEKFIGVITETSNKHLGGNYNVEIYNSDELDVLIGQSEERKTNLKLDLEIDLVDNLQAQYTFDNFVVGESNKESHAAALASAIQPGEFYNPLFIYGNSGLGKTHLLHAIGNYSKKNNKDLKVLYITSNDYVTRVVNSFRDKNTEEFKQDMYNLDILLIDDIQFLSGKDKSHEIFFSIFNELVNNRKQIVITSDKPPTEINGLDDRLISRFYSGLSSSVDSPEFEVAYAILIKKLEQQMINPDNIDDDVISYLATHFAKDVRKLEGALNRVIFYSINFGKEDQITMKIATKAFKNESKKANDIISLDSIKSTVANYYGLTIKQIDSKNRTRIIVNARHISMFLVRKHLDLSYTQIGNSFGGRDHSTVINAYDKISDKLKTDKSYKVAVAEIENKILSN